MRDDSREPPDPRLLEAILDSIKDPVLFAGPGIIQANTCRYGRCPFPHVEISQYEIWG